MSKNTKVTLNKGGTNQCIKEIKDINVPNLWHIIEVIRTREKINDRNGCADLIQECWALAHSLHRHISETGNKK